MPFVRSSFGSFLNKVSGAASRVVGASDRTDSTNGDRATTGADTVGANRATTGADTVGANRATTGADTVGASCTKRNFKPPADTSTTNTTLEAGATVVTDGGDESHELWKRLGELEASLPVGPTFRRFTEPVRLSIYEDCGAPAPAPATAPQPQSRGEGGDATIHTREPARILADEYDVAVVGAGPVGLWCAIILKLLKPEARVKTIPQRPRTSDLEAKLASFAMEVGVVYEIKGSGQRLRRDQAYAVLKAMAFPADETFGKEKDGVTAITVQFMLNPGRDDAVFATLAEASWKSPHRLHCDWHTLHPKLQQSISVWLNAKASLVGERRIPGSETVVGIGLDVYAARKFGIADVALKVSASPDNRCSGSGAAAAPHRRPNRVAAALLVGDAAAGVPFFRALNLGFLCGSLAATCAAAVLSGDTRLDGAAAAAAAVARTGGAPGKDKVASGATAAVKAVATYCSEASAIAAAEIAAARMKQTKYRVGGAWLHVSSALPLQIVKFTKPFARALCGPVAALPPAGTAEYAACVRACSLCLRPFRIDMPSPSAQCGHSGEWHTSLKQCGVKCTARLATSFGQQILAGGKKHAGEKKMSMGHWTCCMAAEEQLPCRNSLAHVEQ
eukprot:gene771-5308_t